MSEQDLVAVRLPAVLRCAVEPVSQDRMMGCCTTDTGGSAPAWAAGDAEVRRALAEIDSESAFVTAGHDVDTGVYEGVKECEVPPIMPPRSKKKKNKQKNTNKKKAEQRGTLAPVHPCRPAPKAAFHVLTIAIVAFTHALAATQTPRRKRTQFCTKE